MRRVVFVDVGGTLWPNRWTSLPDDDFERVDRLREAVPSLPREAAAEIVAALSTVDHPPTERQQTDVLVSEAVRQVAPGVTMPVAAVISAMCLPALGRVDPFPGTRTLLGTLADRGVRVVVVSNVLWRDSEM